MSSNYFIKEYTKCTECSQNSIINAIENKRKYSLQNPSKKQIYKIHIDNCVITKGIRCDYLIISDIDKISFFVELKGQDIQHAIDQLIQSIITLTDKISGYKINARIVLSKVNTPDLRSTKLIKLKELTKRHGGTVRYETILMNEII